MSIATEITRLQNAKALIKTSLEVKGATVPDNAKIDTYNTYVNNLITITEDKFTIVGKGDYLFANAITCDLWDNYKTKFNFTGCTSLIHAFDGYTTTGILDCSSIDTSNTTKFGYMFYNTQADIIKVPSFEHMTTSGGTDNVSMFQYSTVRWIDLRNAKINAATNNVVSMFYGCENLTTVQTNENSFVGDYANVGSLFQNCTGLTTTAGLGFDHYPPITGASGIFKGCTNLVTADLSALSYSGCSMANAFQNCTSLVNVILPSSGNMTSLTSTFSGCTSITNTNMINDNSGLNLSFVQRADYAFQNCTGLTTATIVKSTPKVTNISSMFINCSNLTYLKLHMSTELLTNATNIISGCTSLETLDLGPDMVFTKVTTSSYRLNLSQATNLKNLYLRYTGGVITNIATSFPSSLQHIYVPSALVNTYKAHQMWIGRASLIEAIPD